MNLPKINLKGLGETIANAVSSGWSEHGSKIMLVGGVVGTGLACVLAADASTKAHKILEEKKEEQDVDNLDFKETLKVAAPCYIPTVVVWGISCACVVGGYKTEANNAITAMAAYKLLETSFNDYKTATKDVVGDKKEQKIQQRVTENHMNTYPVSRMPVYSTGKGDSLFFDVYGGRYFRSDIESIKRAVTHLNETLFNYGSATLNEFYNEVNLPTIKFGDDFVFNAEDGSIKLDFMYSDAEDGSPCAEVEFEKSPMFREGYNY